RVHRVGARAVAWWEVVGRRLLTEVEHDFARGASAGPADNSTHSCPPRPLRYLPACPRTLKCEQGATMRILVAGDRGYIGAVLVPFLPAAGHHLDGLDTRLYEGCDFCP